MRLTDREEPKHKLDRGDDFKLVMVLGERVRQRPALRRRAPRLGESRVPPGRGGDAVGKPSNRKAGERR
jgi:hypothetical protein